MDRNALKPLPGLEDRIGLDIKALRYLGAKLSEIFQRYGYEEIETPFIERPSTWTGDSEITQKRKFTDVLFRLNQYASNGNSSVENGFTTLHDELVELRPEGTLPVCRYLANRIVEGNNALPLKVFYITPMFRNEELAHYTDLKKLMFYQAGVELIGPSSLLADIEIFNIALTSMNQIGFQGQPFLRINDVGIFEGIVGLIQDQSIQHLIISEQEAVSLRKEMKEAIDAISKYHAQKDHGLEQQARENLVGVTSKYKIYPEVSEALSIITENVGSRQAVSNGLQRLKTLMDGKVFQAVTHLENLANILEELEIPYSIDLAVVRGLDMYTGPVFQIDAELKGGVIIVEVAGGGRYDKGVGSFLRMAGLGEREIPATGFAYGLDRMVKAMIETRSLPETGTVSYNLQRSTADVLIYDPDVKTAMVEAEQLRNQGLRVEVDLMGRSREELQAYAKDKKMEFRELQHASIDNQ